MKIPSKYLEQVVDQLAILPGVGKRTALRLALQILKKSPDEIERFAQAFLELKDHLKKCKSCGNVSDLDYCGICADPNRDQSMICVVEDVRDVMAIEETSSFKGVYQVLGGIISPMDGIGPQDLNVESLLQKMESGKVNEVIFALSATMEGDTTNFYLYKKLKPYNIKVTTLSRGVSVGAELHYADGITLGRSILNRMPFKVSH
ncbi:MAG: recombination protein RecR [Bacteroidetes bacterium]|nr:MAG: recombination protein RecR [Bacteroidota bacterium]